MTPFQMGLLAGCFIGGIVGVFAMCLMIVASNADMNKNTKPLFSKSNIDHE